MRQSIIHFAFQLLGVQSLYNDVVVEDRLTDIKPKIRADLEKLLSSVNENNPFFKGRFDQFLSECDGASDEKFFELYSKLPSFSKQDYAEAGFSVMPEKVVEKLQGKELIFDGKPWKFLKTLRSGDFLMPMATGGSTSSPLAVYMTKYHTFSMMYTFFKCWYRMGWRPGDRMLVFYPSDTYYIDDMARYNRFSNITGFRISLFSKIDEQTISNLVDEINEFKPKIFLVFPSPMNMIADTIRKKNLPLKHHPELINFSGETFFDCQRKNIQQVFTGSKLEDSYGSVELGEIAHETKDGLEIFANVAYIETEPNEQGQPEMICTRLDLSDFPFIRYKMRDVADIEFIKSEDGTERFVITNIEGKDTNYICSDSGAKFYPSFFNRFVNDLNVKFEDHIVEIKVYERGQQELEVQFIVKDDRLNDSIRVTTEQLLRERISANMNYDVSFVDYIDHDYRRKYRVIERIGDVEYAGGIVGNQQKLDKIADDQKEDASQATTRVNH